MAQQINEQTLGHVHEQAPEVEMIAITVDEYNSLKKDSRWLGALESAGVDNWSGYDYARELFNNED